MVTNFEHRTFVPCLGTIFSISVQDNNYLDFTKSRRGLYFDHAPESNDSDHAKCGGVLYPTPSSVFLPSYTLPRAKRAKQ